jgi:hypothetical protein
LTISEAHRAFRFGLDKMDGLNAPNFLPEEIDLLLNQAQERFIKQRYDNTNIKRTGFEQDEKRTEDLKEILESKILSPAALTYPSGKSAINSAFFTLPADNWFIIWEKAYINCTTCNTTFTIST